MRTRTLLLLLSALLALTQSMASAELADVEPDCAGGVRLYAVAAETGNLTEMLYCNGFQQATVVDHGDWRSYRSIFAATTGQEVLVYAITADQELLSYRQATPGRELAPPTRVDGSWSGARNEFASAPGVLHALDEVGRLNTFVVSGMAAIQQPTPLLLLGPPYPGTTVTAVHTGQFAETNIPGRMHLRIWRIRSPYDAPSVPRGAAFESGALPQGVTGLVGSEPNLFGVDGQGRVVLLRQQVPSRWHCRESYYLPWEVVDRSSERYERVVVPVTVQGVPTVGDLPAYCPPGHPWEWQ